MSEIAAPETPRPPTVYFIDDSATMREVMKIAFRRENIGVVACQDAATALAEIEKAQPDVVITDVIMPGKNGFEVCQHIKQHPQLGQTPVVLLSGVVNREVADKAFSVKADELIRKPFQPQDLIARVKQLLAPKTAAAPVPPASVPANGAARPGGMFGGVFGSGQPPARAASPAPPSPGVVPAPPRNPFMQAPAPVAPSPARPTNSHESAKLRLEVMRLENLVKKLQSELAAEREYARALEAHVKTLQESE
jgi:CheY-like chemotaxis protein